ncbi:hypothetical protein Q8A73_016773 [Channa argus]|nr:hypothetical protein Q8A73_016773 [Channa argus]
MASPGLLFLVLMSSSVLVCTSPNQNQLEEVTPEKIRKVNEVLKATGKIILKTIDEIRFTVVPFLGIIPVYGPLISAITTLALVGVSVVNKNVKTNPILDTIKSEFENLNSKLDQYHEELRWDTWTSSAYHKPEKNIKVAWTKYKTLVQSLLLAKDDNEKKRHRDDFIDTYSKYEPATKTLHALLMAKQPTLINDFGEMLVKHVKCHEQDLRTYTEYVNKLICKGNTMNQIYYKLKNIESPARVNEEAQIAYDCSSAMFKTHQYCISHSMDYIKKDVEGLIDTTKKRQELANDVRSFLDKTYERYDWMVVAFITKSSKHKIIETLNSHILSGYTEVTKGEVSVAVARQVKGTHTKAAEVRKAIIGCVPTSTKCYQVADKLRQCSKSVGGILVSQTYTAVHAYTRKAHDSHSAKEAPEEVYADPENPSAQTPYIYSGSCEKSPGVKGGKFVVMIKSDEEMMMKDPCSKLNCGENESRGRCVRMADIFLAMCDCKFPYYGQHCELSLEDYKRDLQKESNFVVVDRRHRTQPRTRVGI